MQYNGFVVSPPHSTTSYTTLLRKRNSVELSGCAFFQSVLATSAIGLPASKPKLKQALKSPETIPSTSPRPNLYSIALPADAPCAEGGASAVTATSSNTGVREPLSAAIDSATSTALRCFAVFA